MINQGKISSLVSLVNAGGTCGKFLIARPLIFLFFSRKRDLNAYAAVDVSAMVFIFYAVLCFFVAVRELNRPQQTFGRDLITNSPLFWIIAYTLLGVVSMFWSVNLQLTGFRAFECMSMMLLMVAVVQNLFAEGGCNIAIKWTLLYVTVDIIFSIVKALSYTTDVFELMQTSQMMATTFFYIALYQSEKKWWHYLIMVMSIFSMSTVAYIGMALGCVSMFFWKQKYRTTVFIGSLILGTIILVIGPHKFIKETVFFDKKTISIHETTGRDHIMDVSIQALENKPEGYGFFAGEPYLLYHKNLVAINGHNSLFSAAMGLGIPGMLLIIIFFVMMVKITFSRYISPKYRARLIGCFIVSFLHSMGNPGIGSRVYGGWMPAMYATVLICGFYVYGKHYEEINESNDEE